MELNEPKNSFHAKSVKTALSELQTAAGGLSTQEVKLRQKKFGPNSLPQKRRLPAIFLFLRQFKSGLVYILLAAAAISFYFQHYTDVYIIGVVVIANAIIGFAQEFKAERSISALKKMVISKAKVLRDGKLTDIPSSELVPGDIIIIQAGDQIPADARIVEQKNLRTIESALTGEPYPTNKTSEILPEATVLAERSNMIWQGTFAAGGEAKGVVTEIGGGTALGIIAGELTEIKVGLGHFEKLTNELALQMSVVAIGSAVLIFLAGYFVRHFAFGEILLFTVASLVSAIPEGLPAILIVVVSIGAYRMAKRNAIVRSLAATETLGSVTVICTDKTGTLTQSLIQAAEIWLPTGRNFEVTGRGWEPIGDFFEGENLINAGAEPDLKRLLTIAAVCNRSRVRKDDDGSYGIIGDPTEAALLVLSEKSGLTESIAKSVTIIDDLPFSTEARLRASLVNEIADGANKIYSVGSPEILLAKSRLFIRNGVQSELTEDERQRIIKAIEVMTKKAMRVVGLAYVQTAETEKISEEQVDGLIFAGLVGMFDPPRPEVNIAVKQAQSAGIRIIMLTGDHKETALAIGRQIGLIGEKKSIKGIAFTESELEKMDEKEFSNAVSQGVIFARLTPTMKLRIAKELQAQNQIVAMTGDGVNDAPALKQADIGIAMGIEGTDVARSAAKIILADDNFASIISAIEEGRVVFRNTRQASAYLITTNFAEMLTLLACLLIGLPLPLLPIQIFWLNLVTDGINGLSLATENHHEEILKEAPRPADEKILTAEILPMLILVSIVMVAATIFTFDAYQSQGLEKARAGAFAILAFTQIFNVLNMRSSHDSFFKLRLSENKLATISFIVSALLSIAVLTFPPLGKIFGFAQLSAAELIWLIGISSLVLWGDELYKMIKRRLEKNVLQ